VLFEHLIVLLLIDTVGWVAWRASGL